MRYQIYIECLYPFSNSFNLRTEVIHIYFKMTDNSNASTSAVSVKAPQFDETAATRWFQIIESQFVLANVSVPSTKFHIAFSNLPVCVTTQISDSVIADASYDDLKKAVIATYARSAPELFDTLMNQHNIMCTKPSLYLNELRKIASAGGLGLSDEFIKMKFIKGLPDSIRSNIVTYKSNDLDELARVADMLMSFSTPSHVAHIKPSFEYPQRHTQRHSQRHSPSRNPSSSPNYSFRNSPSPVFNENSIPMGVRAFHSKQRPHVCRFHIYYGNDARSCKPWCILSTSSLKMQPSSRSSSPISRPFSNPSEN